MPVTAKLSRRFYEAFGDEIANELVEWFNRVDEAYRSEFRDLFEVHFSRFDAKLEQRASEFEGKTDRRFAALEAKLEQRIGELDVKTDRRFSQLEAKTDQRFAELEARFPRLEAKVEQRLAEVKAGLIKWMFAFWVGNLAVTGGFVFAAVGLLRR